MAEDYFLYILDLVESDPYLNPVFADYILPLACMAFSNAVNIADLVHYFVHDSYFDYYDFADFEVLSPVPILTLDILSENLEEILEVE